MISVDFQLYADDSQLYTTFSCEDKDDFTTTICRTEGFVLTTTSKMTLNTNKTLYSKFRLAQRLLSIKIETDIIETTNKARNIDVIFDNTVTMSFHFNNIVKEAFYYLRNRAKIRKYINVIKVEVVVHAGFLLLAFTWSSQV